MRTIVVATDGSPPARAAFSSALELARSQGATILVLHVAASGEPATVGLLDGEEDQARRHGVSCVVELIDGDPADAILRRAKELDAHLVVVGSHGQDEAAGARLGSVSSCVLRRSERPLLIVRARSGAAPR